MLARLEDQAILDCAGSRLAFTTDSFVVQPLVFPGGDIGSLAVHGTVNDVAMCGARPLVISAGFILEEGMPLDQLGAIAESMGAAARAAGVTLVTGDTKVVDRGLDVGVGPGRDVAGSSARRLRNPEQNDRRNRRKHHRA